MQRTRSTNPGFDNLLNTADDVFGSPGVMNNNLDGTFNFPTNYGFREQVTSRRSLPYTGAAFSNSLFWDGRATATFRDPATEKSTSPFIDLQLRSWYRLNSFDGSFAAVNWGISTDKPVPADYDYDDRVDVAVYRDGLWFIVQSSSGQISYGNFGSADDVPIPTVYVK